MGLLLDTHVIVWLYEEPDLVPDNVKAQIEQTAQIIVSVASAWEHELKRAKHPKRTARPFEEMIAGSGFEECDLPFQCFRYAYSLPPIHADPFDRMLMAHALSDGHTLVTADTIVSRYPVPTLW